MTEAGKINWKRFDPEDRTTWPNASADIVFLTLIRGRAEFHRGYMGWTKNFYEVISKRVRKDGSWYVTKRNTFSPDDCDEISWAEVNVPDWWTRISMEGKSDD